MERAWGPWIRASDELITHWGILGGSECSACGFSVPQAWPTPPGSQKGQSPVQMVLELGGWCGAREPPWSALMGSKVSVSQPAWTFTLSICATQLTRLPWSPRPEVNLRGLFLGALPCPHPASAGTYLTIFRRGCFCCAVLPVILWAKETPENSRRLRLDEGCPLSSPTQQYLCHSCFHKVGIHFSHAEAWPLAHEMSLVREAGDQQRGLLQTSCWLTVLHTCLQLWVGGGGALRPLPLLLLFSLSVMSNSLRPPGLQHARLPCPSPSIWICLSSHPLNWWHHLTISSSVISFSSCLQSFPASGSFPMSQLFASGGQGLGASASASVLTMSIQGWFPLGLTGLISLLSEGLSRVFSSTTVWKHKFFGAQPSFWSAFALLSVKLRDIVLHVCFLAQWKTSVLSTNA